VHFLNWFFCSTDLKSVLFYISFFCATDLKSAFKRETKKIFCKGNLKGFFGRVKQNSSTLEEVKTYLPLIILYYEILGGCV
jgi:hypothetical protein